MLVVLVALGVHLYGAVVVVAVVPRPGAVDAEEDIHNPSLTQMVLPARADTCHNAEALAVLILSAEELTILKELRAVDVEGHHTSIGTQVPAMSGLLEVVAVLANEHAKIRVLAIYALPRRVCKINGH